MSKGIDYGMGQTNIDHANSIRYGVIHIHEVTQAWCDESTQIYSDACPYCGNGEGMEAGKTCPSCERELKDGDFDCQESMGCEYNDEGYVARQGGDSPDIFITKSPYYTRAAFCSPCAPGAGDLSHPCDDGAKSYCFGHDWFEGGKAPYPVFSVETNEEVKPNV